MTVKIDKTNPSRKKIPQKLHTQKKVKKPNENIELYKNTINNEHYIS